MAATLLRFLTDHHIERKVTEWFRQSQSKHKIATAAEHGQANADDRDLVKFATDNRRILLTKDQGFRSSRSYPICTHSGIIVLLPEPDTKDATIGLLQKFLQSGKRKLAFHAIVTLLPTHFVVENQNGSTDYRYRVSKSPRRKKRA